MSPRGSLLKVIMHCYFRLLTALCTTRNRTAVLARARAHARARFAGERAPNAHPPAGTVHLQTFHAYVSR